MSSLAGKTLLSTYTSLLKLEGDTQTLVAGGGTAIQIKTGDNEVTPMYLNTDRVGIGTNSPGALLEIDNTAAVTGLLIDQNSDQIGIQLDHASTSAKGAYFSGASTTGTLIDVRADALTSGYGMYIHSNSANFTTGNGLLRVLVDNPSASGTALSVGQDGSGDIIKAQDGGVTVFIVENGGNVGIGATEPGFKLEVSGDTDILNLIGSGTGGPQLRMTDSSSSSNGDTFAYQDFNAKDASANSQLFNRVEHVIDVNTHAAEESSIRFQVFSGIAGTHALDTDALVIRGQAGTGAYVGIGTASPSSTLEVNGTINGTYITGTATDNVGIGANAVDSITTGDYNVGMGKNALTTNTEGANNVAIGYGALDANTTANSLVAIGYDALGANTEGAGNVGVGWRALWKNIDGDYNTACGAQCLPENTTGVQNSAFGRLALFNNTEGEDNTAIGYGAMEDNVDGNNNTAIGHSSLNSNTDGTHNTAVGNSALSLCDSGTYNTGVGNAAGNAITTGTNNVCIGRNSDASATVDNQIAIGYGAITDGVNKGRWGNSSIATNNIQVDWTVDSDSRIKKDIENSDLGLSFINALTTRKYKKKHPSEYDAELLEARYKSGGSNYNNDKDEIIKDEFDDSKIWNGLIAQEVKAVMDSLGVGFSGWSEDTQGKQGIQYATLVVPLIKAVQELSAEVEALKNA